MRRSLREQLRRYPGTFLATIAVPLRRRSLAQADHWCPAGLFIAVSGLIGYGLSALLGDQSIFRHYEWPPSLTATLQPLSQLPGAGFIFALVLSGLAIAVAATLSYLLLKLTGARVAARGYGVAFLYFGGGPLLLLTLVQTVGLPFTLGAVVTLPEWLTISLLLALWLYFAVWIARCLIWLEVRRWQSTAAAALAALTYVLAPANPTVAMRLESYAMTVDSMAPAVVAGSVSVANEAVFNWRPPARGDLVVFYMAVNGTDVAVLRRVIGLSGDTVEVRDGQLFLNGDIARREAGATSPYAGQGSYATVETLPSGARYTVIEPDAGSPDFATVEVPRAHVFVLVDNRALPGAIDSRQFGPVRVSDLRGVMYYQLAPERRRLQ